MPSCAAVTATLATPPRLPNPLIAVRITHSSSVYKIADCLQGAALLAMMAMAMHVTGTLDTLVGTNRPRAVEWWFDCNDHESLSLKKIATFNMYCTCT